MKRRLFLILALLWALPAAAQVVPPLQIINAVSSGITVCTSGNCAVWSIPSSSPSLTAQITGTMTSMTVTFEGTADGQTWFAVQTTKLVDGTAGSTTTSTGQYAITNLGLVRFRVRCTTYSSGAVNVTLTRGVASAKASGGSGGGVTSITGTANQIIASAATGAVGLSTPQDIGTSSSVTFGNVNVPSAGAFTYNSVNMIRAVTADRNYFLGPSGNLTLTGIDNIAVGSNAFLADTTGQLNVAIGTDAMRLSTTANSSTAVGYKTLSKNTTGDSNTAIGKEALRENTTGSSSVAVGPAALMVNTTGGGNMAIGHATMTANVDGANNTAVGTSALSQNVSGANNVAVGVNALLATTTDNNIGIGRGAGAALTSGGYNIEIGFNTGGGLTTGQANTIIGGQIAGLTSTMSNNVIIGDGFGAVKLQIDSGNKVTLGGVMSITAPTIASGGCTSPAVTHNNGTAAFLLTLGTSCTGVKTIVLTMPAASHFWACDAENNTSDAQQAANTIASRATSTTAVTLTNYTRTTGLTADYTASDTLLVKCSGE